MSSIVDRAEVRLGGKPVKVEIVKFRPGLYGVRPAGATCEPPLRTFGTLAAARQSLGLAYPTERTGS